MTEQAPKREFSQDYYTDLAFFHFTRLVKDYGKVPQVVNTEALERIREKDPQKFTDATKVLVAVAIPMRVNVPASIEDREIEVINKISGVDYGSGEIFIHYEFFDQAGNVSITKDSEGKVRISSFNLLSRDMSGLHHLDRWGRGPDMKAVTELLIRAEQILSNPKEVKEKPKTLRQRILGKVVKLLEAE